MEQISLNGTWRLRGSDGQRGRKEYAERDETDIARYIDATVPGEVHLDLIRAGLIGEPCEGLNALAARWVEESIWSYRREFDAPADAVEGRAWLVFEQLDLAATIVLNGQTIGEHSNFFYPCRIDVTGKLKPGSNLLSVHVEAGLFKTMNKSSDGMNVHLDSQLAKRPWLRKPQNQFGWDWSTRMLNVGISGNVRLEWTDAPMRVDSFVPLAAVSDDLKTATLRARLHVEGFGREAQSGELTVEIPEAGVRHTAAVSIQPGAHPVEAAIDLPNPELWWPVGHGQPHRYDVRATLKVGDHTSTHTLRVGFRHVRVNQDKHPVEGSYFTLEINGRKIFAKGGNIVPADMIQARADGDRYRRLIELALEANFNMLRVWGGGLYETEDFYELCDAHGIMVWQDFVYACAKYPMNDQAFFEDAKREAIYNIRRLAKHPSLIVWCGNNEMEQGCWQWGYDKGVVYPDYAFFHLTLPQLMKQEDPTRYYQPSSPFSPECVDPNRDEQGDQHPWSIGFQNTDFRGYRKMISRFANEGGILGPNALPTVLKCLPEGHRHVQSFAWQLHDNSVDSWFEPSAPDGMTQQWLGKDIRKMSIEQYVYWAGLLHGEGLREYIDNFRRRMFDSSSAIFWMYNDCWPAVRSWTIVDYDLRRTPAFHPVRRAMQPVNVVVAEDEGVVTVYGVNDTMQDVSAKLRYGVFDFAGPLPIDRAREVTLRANASTPLATFPLSEWLDASRSAAFAVLFTGHTNRVIAQNKLILPLFKEMQWPEAKVGVTVRGGVATFSSETFAWGICLDLNGEGAVPDNFFDCYPSIPYSIPWTSKEPPRVLHVGNLVD